MVVEYGADIHAIDFGSGFPTPATADLFPEDEVCTRPFLFSLLLLHDNYVIMIHDNICLALETLA